MYDSLSLPVPFLLAVLNVLVLVPTILASSLRDLNI